MSETIDNIQPGPIDATQLAAHRYQCHHIFPDGVRCGSPALRNETRCYYHHETRKPVSNPRERNARTNTFEFPFPDSRTSVQAALGDLMTRIASNDIDPRRAGLLLYCLQLAQSNLKASELAQQKPGSPASLLAEVEQKVQQAVAGHSDPEQREGEESPHLASSHHLGSMELTSNSQAPGGHGTTAEVEGSGLRVSSPEVQTDLLCFEDFAQKQGEGPQTFCGESGSKPTQISRATFAALLESLARHQGVNIDDPIYQNHNEDSPILAALRAEADQLATDNLQLTTPLVILNHSNAKQTNCAHHPRRLGLPCRDSRKRHRTGPQAHLRQAARDLPQHPHPRQ